MTAIFLSEVFSAIQGEGALVGERQLFVRLAGCNIRCSYCDQPEALEKKPGPCRLERSAGRRDWEWTSSPLEVDKAASAVERVWQSAPHHSISVTGGEPLLQASRLAELLELLSLRGRRIMLETNGTLPGGLDLVIDLVTHVSMDIKLDSVDAQGVSLDVQRRFLEACAAAPSIMTFVKVVIGPATSEAELDEAVCTVDGVSREIEVFLQPVTPFGTVTATPSPAQVLELQERALRIHPRVRVVPQTHRLIGQL